MLECPFLAQRDLSVLIIPSPLYFLRAVIIAQLSTSSTFFTLLSWLPTFFKETFPESKVRVAEMREGLGCVQRGWCWGPAKAGGLGSKGKAEGFGESRLGGRRRWEASLQGQEAFLHAYIWRCARASSLRVGRGWFLMAW